MKKINEEKLTTLGFDLQRISQKMEGASIQRETIQGALLELRIDERLSNNIGVIETIRNKISKSASDSISKKFVMDNIHTCENGFIFCGTTFLIGNSDTITISEGTVSEGTVINTIDKTGMQLSHQYKKTKNEVYSFRVPPMNIGGQIRPGLIIYDFYFLPFASKPRREVFLDNASSIFCPPVLRSAEDVGLQPASIIGDFLLCDQRKKITHNIDEVFDKTLGCIVIADKDLSDSFEGHNLDYCKNLKYSLQVSRAQFLNQRKKFIDAKKGNYSDFENNFITTWIKSLEEEYPVGANLGMPTAPIAPTGQGDQDPHEHDVI